MNYDVMAERYSAQDAGFALQHGNFGDFQRNLRKGNFLILPREVTPGPSAEYFYSHLVELCIHMHIGAAFSRDVGKAVAMGLFGRLHDNDTGLKNVNALSREDMEALYATMPEEMEGPQQYIWFVKHPHLFLGEDLISRDVANPTFALFNPLRPLGVMEVSLVTGATTLSEAYAKVLKTSTAAAGSEEYRRTIEDTCHVPSVVNLTSILSRLDERLAIRLRARAPIGRRVSLSMSH